MKFKNKFFIYVLLIQCCSLFAYEFSHDTNKKNNIPHIVMPIQYPNAPVKSNWSFSCDVKTVPDSYSYSANYSVIAQHASPELKHYFAHTVMPLMYHTTTQGYQYILPGYACADGLRYCKNQLSQFSHSDAVSISGITQRLETYCARIETILFNGKNHAFCDSISRADQIKLIHVYADFLKEFCASEAPHIFLDQSQTAPLMQQLMGKIDWSHYDGR